MLENLNKKRSFKRRALFFLVGLPVAAIILLAFTTRTHTVRIPSFLRKSGPHNVILIVADTLRADHVSCYGYGKPTTPHIDRLAGEGALFEKAYVNLPFSLPSFTTMFTSLYPHSHGITAGLSALSPSAITLAEVLKEKGWQTAAVIGASNLSAHFGLNQGFQFYDEPLIGKPPLTPQRIAEEVNRIALDWLNRRDKAKPFFLMVHYFDVHKPYDPPPPFNMAVSPEPSRKNKKKTIAGYDGEISYMDAQFQLLLDQIERSGLSKETLFIFTSDHGEGLGEHGSGDHGETLFEQEVHIPLILKGPGIPKGLRVRGIVQHVDLAPTILDFLELSIPSQFQGVSFLPALNGAGVRKYALFERSTKLERYQRQWGVRTENEKFIWNENGNHLFFDLQKDPRELDNLYEKDQERALQLFNDGLKFRSSFAALPLAQKVGGTQRERQEVEEALKALGYLNQ